jgi:Tfp pilus assembly ATPase PilU
VQEGERDGKSLHDAMEDGQLDGMQTFDSELYRLIQEGLVDRELALSYATNRTNLQLKLDTQGLPDAKDKEKEKAAAPAKPGFSAPGAKKPGAPGKGKSQLDDLLER